MSGIKNVFCFFLGYFSRYYVCFLNKFVSVVLYCSWFWKKVWIDIIMLLVRIIKLINIYF